MLTTSNAIRRNKRGDYAFRIFKNSKQEWVSGYSTFDEADTAKTKYHRTLKYNKIKRNLRTAHELGILVDRKHRSYLADYLWRLKDGYAVTDSYIGDRKSKLIKLHHLILPRRDGLVTDHINNVRHDNREGNLRRATPQQNSMNQSKSSVNTSGYTGVCKSAQSKINIWRSYISIGGKQKHLGTFSCRHRAAVVRDIEAKKLFGEFHNPQISPNFTCI